MAIRFDKYYVDVAREICNKVFVDTENPVEYTGSETGYCGDRIRIYVTDWEYEEPEIFRDNASFEKYIDELLDIVYDGCEFLKPCMN